MWKRDTDKEKPTKKDTPEYQKPKILLVDLSDSVLDSVRSAGFNASAGTFGTPYKVELSDDYTPVIYKADLPNYTEQEIIIIDLTPPETIDRPEGEKITSEGEKDLWAKCSRGEIDPRPRVMNRVHNAFDRIFDYGGLFVIFAQPRLRPDMVWGKISYGKFKIDSKTYVDNWSFLSNLYPEYFEIKSDFGEEISVPNMILNLSVFFERLLEMLDILLLLIQDMKKRIGYLF